MKWSSAWVAGAAAVFLASSAQAVQIIPTFDSSITSAANSAEIESTIIAATRFYTNFSDPVDVNIYFGLGSTNHLVGESLTSFYGAAYSDYLEGLGIQASLHPENTVLQTAYSNLQHGNTAENVVTSSANLDALLVPFGITLPGVVDGAFDGAITLSDSPGEIVFSGPVGPGQYDAFAVVQHEIDEVLGVGSALNQVWGAPGSGAISALDLDRYDGFQSPSYTYDPSEHAYFSYDGGATDIEDYNQIGGRDYGDWAKIGCSGIQHVQDWGFCSGAPRFGLTRSSPEVFELQAIGYNLTPVPEPTAWTMMILGFGFMGARLRRRTKRGDPAAARRPSIPH